MNLWIALLFLLGINNGSSCGNAGGCGGNNGCGCDSDCMRPWGIPGGNSCGTNNMGNAGGCGCAACSGDDNVSDGASCECAGQNGSREFPSF